MTSYKNLPDFDSLPKVKDMPQGCAWGVFDKDGKKDVLGTVNLLTPDVVKAAASEVQEGVSVSLKYAINTLLTGWTDQTVVGRLGQSKHQDSDAKD
jgi:hypothetical protein